jgi:hypothetical protein
MGNLTREHAERVAGLEATLEAKVGEASIPYRMLRPTIANEPDRDRRRELEAARNALTEEHLNPIYLEAADVEQQATEALGAPNYRDLYVRFGFRLDELAAQCQEFLDSTERLYLDAIDRLFRDRVGLSLDIAERWDVGRLFRAPNWDKAFPEDRMLPALEGTLSDLGIDLRAQANVELDIVPALPTFHAPKGVAKRCSKWGKTRMAGRFPPFDEGIGVRYHDRSGWQGRLPRPAFLV